MSNPVCAACGHVNRAGADACEMCDARLYSFNGAAAEDPSHGRPFGTEGAPSSSWSESGPDAPGGDWSPADDIPSPPFKSAGDVISPMLAVYRKHFTLVGLLVLVTMVPEALIQFGVTAFRQSQAAALLDGTGGGGGGGALVVPGTGFLTLMVVSGVILWLLAIACGALLSASLVYAVVDLQRAGRSSAGACLRRGLKVLWKVYLVTLVSSILTGVGFMLLVVPGVILSLMFAVCVPALVIEGLGPIEALERSNRLTKGYKGLIFVTFFLWGVLVFVLNALISWSFSHGASSPLEMLPVQLLQSAVLGMINSTLSVLAVYIYLGLLRERRSGFQTTTFTS
ncbi:MAG: hypothetical protein JOZ96_05405 [Acidobacteria bacterium]|nr:hypothetical protein [Acidobacteriota bacterium]